MWIKEGISISRKAEPLNVRTDTWGTNLGLKRFADKDTFRSDIALEVSIPVTTASTPAMVRPVHPMFNSWNRYCRHQSSAVNMLQKKLRKIPARPESKDKRLEGLWLVVQWDHRCRQGEVPTFCFDIKNTQSLHQTMLAIFYTLIFFWLSIMQNPSILRPEDRNSEQWHQLQLRSGDSSPALVSANMMKWIVILY